MFALLLLLQVTPPEVTPPPPDDGADAEVVVVARRGKCSVAVADRMISDREFRSRAKEWAAGTPVRVTVTDRSDYHCMAKIMFRLQQYGVTRAEIVAPGAP